jgi:hypothetical protein
MNIRSKINPKNIGDRTPLTAQTKNLPAVIKPDYGQVRSKDILLRDRSRDNLPAVYKKPIPKSPMPKSTSLIKKGIRFGVAGAALTGLGYLATGPSRRYNLAPKVGEDRDLRVPITYSGLEDF